MSHTQGPWRACTSGQIVAGPMSRQIARIWNTKNREADEANANLIAAAPDLLEALEDMLLAYCDPGNQGSDHDEKVQAARTAIAKARGKS